jgi:hypothetical protein
VLGSICTAPDSTATVVVLRVLPLEVLIMFGHLFPRAQMLVGCEKRKQEYLGVEL